MLNNLNIWTFNVNSIRKKMDRINELLNKHNIDILLVTETKIKIGLESEIIIPKGYNVIWNSNLKTFFHGVAFFYKEHITLTLLCKELPNLNKFKMVRKDLKNNKKVSDTPTTTLDADTQKAHNTEGRLLTVKCEIKDKSHNDLVFIIVGTYVPNSGCDRKEPLKRLAYRTLRWDKDLYHHLLQLEKEYSKVIWLGDLNVTRFDNDIYYPKINIAGTTEEERSNFNEFLNSSKWIDTWHVKNPDKVTIRQRCTYGEDMKCKLRLDYIICSPSLEQNIISSTIDHRFEGSDHVPIGTVFNFI